MIKFYSRVVVLIGDWRHVFLPDSIRMNRSPRNVRNSATKGLTNSEPGCVMRNEIQACVWCRQVSGCRVN